MKPWQLCSTSRICRGQCHHGILAVVLLCITVARVLAIGYLLVGFWCMWCHFVEEAAGRFFGLVAEAAGGMGLAFVVEVEVVFGGAWVSYMLDRTEALASVPAGEEYQLLAGALLVLIFHYEYNVALLQPAELLPTF
jgi:hypothetical protein